MAKGATFIRRRSSRIRAAAKIILIQSSHRMKMSGGGEQFGALDVSWHIAERTGAFEPRLLFPRNYGAAPDRTPAEETRQRRSRLSAGGGVGPSPLVLSPRGRSRPIPPASPSPFTHLNTSGSRPVPAACASSNNSASSASPVPEKQWIFIKSSNHSIVYKRPVGIRRKAGTMEVNVLKDSIPIHCDGFYLFFLEGTIFLHRAKAPLILRVYREPQESFLSINCSNQKTEVQEIIVHDFRSSDEIYLQYDGDGRPNIETSRQDLTLSLIMLTPHSYCSPEK